MYSDYMPVTEDVSPQMKCFLRENDILAIECVLLARGIKTYYGFQQAQQDPTERQILLEKSLGIYRVLGGSFPQFRQNALKLCFGDNRDNQSLHHHMEQDEHSILNCLGGCTDHSTILKRSFGSVFHQARMAGFGREISQSLDYLTRSHELAQASLKCAVEAYAAIFCYKENVGNDFLWETLKAAHRACKDNIFWKLASVCDGVESKDAMSETYKSAAHGVWCGAHMTDTFSKTYLDLTSELAGGPKKSGQVLSRCAAKLMGGQVQSSGQQLISAKTQGQDADEAHAGLHAESAGSQGSSSSALKPVTMPTWRQRWRQRWMLRQKAQVDAQAEGTKESASCSSASVSSSGFSVQGKGHAKPQPEVSTKMMSELLSEEHDNKVELLFQYIGQALCSMSQTRCDDEDA